MQSAFRYSARAATHKGGELTFDLDLEAFACRLRVHRYAVNKRPKILGEWPTVVCGCCVVCQRL